VTAPRFTDRVVLVAAACAYLPLAFLGFGADGDSYSVVRTGRDLLAHGHYQMSRAPGFPTHEFAAAALVAIGGSIAADLGSIGVSLLAVWSISRICATADVPDRDLVAWVVAFNPLYWVNSASTIDYVWAIGLTMCGLYAWMLDRPRLAGVLFGLGIGARVTAVIVPVAAAAASVLSTDRQPLFRRHHAPAVLTIAAAVSIALFFAPFAAAGYSLAFVRPAEGRLLSYYLPSWGWTAHAVRWTYKNLYLLGPFATAALAGYLARRLRRVGGFRGPTSLLWLAAFAAAGFEAAFWIAPLETAYLLPLLPFLAITLALVFRSRRLLAAVIVLELVYAFVNVRFLSPDLPGNARTAAPTFRIERGVLLNDLSERARMQASGGR
jgi:hypothetical protein